ncbi:MAG TPA: hydroxymethylbilane synthase [Candidatus Limnocylindrales bacterium]|nr:hydroxymethylbilane synthase [Candidatus Limnocylindrales bacterium]
MKLRVGTRRSPLALTQTRQSMRALAVHDASLSYELVEIVTSGDRIQDRPLRESGGKGLFIKELDEALLDGRIDCAVHSLKDVPSELAPGIAIAAVLERADPRDLLVTTDGRTLDELPADVLVGTTSLRRSCQLLARRPKARVRMLRGNIETRVKKLLAGECAATFLAAAGIARLGLALAPAHGVVLDPSVFVPAPGQGALAITARADDEATIAALRPLDHPPSHAAIDAERAFARAFGGGCHLPLAAFAEVTGTRVTLTGLLSSPDGQRVLREQAIGPAEHGAILGERLARGFFDRGAAEIIAAAEPS